MTDAYLAALLKKIPGDAQGRTYADAIAAAMVKAALAGKVNAASELADRVEGKPAQELEVSGEVKIQRILIPVKLAAPRKKAPVPSFD
jgi:hypothetical protein